MPSRTHTHRHAFTLIELLVVVAIIAVLIGLLIPALNRTRLSTQRTKATHDVSQISTALRAYLDEYGRPFGNVMNYANWPANQKAVEVTINGIQMEPELMAMLAGGKGRDSGGKFHNPKMLPFLDVGTNMLDNAGRYVDPWGNAYKCMMDYDGDGSIDVRFTSFEGSTNLQNVRVAVWSRGPNGSDKSTDNGWDDDIRNW